MTEEVRLAYDANHTYRDGYQQGRADMLSKAKEILARLLINEGISCAMYELIIAEMESEETE